MPRFDDRFARQDRCEPPSEFPLTSPCPGIVHHLSGLSTNALAPRQVAATDDAGRCCARHFTVTGSHLACLRFATGVLEPIDSRPCSTPRSVFQDGSDRVPRPRGIDLGQPPLDQRVRRRRQPRTAEAVRGTTRQRSPAGAAPHPKAERSPQTILGRPTRRRFEGL